MKRPGLTRTRKIFAAVGALCAVGAVALFYSVNLSIRSVYRDDYARFEGIRKGMSEEEVVRRLGQPYKVYAAESAPEDYYVAGYSHRRRPITNKVYIYVATEPIAYIYFDRQERVEEVFVGGS